MDDTLALFGITITHYKAKQCTLFGVYPKLSILSTIWKLFGILRAVCRIALPICALHLVQYPQSVSWLAANLVMGTYSLRKV